MASQKFGRYELEREIGRGGMAVVYLARDPYMKRQVAVKVLPRQFTFDPQFRARFQREAEVIAALEHPHIVPIYDFGENDEQPFIVMRYMPGGSLHDRIAKGPLSLAEMTAILDRLAEALDEAHRQGVIHRDIKPGNVLFDSAGEAYLSDFGIAKLTETTSALSGTGIIGTPDYMSPEQARASKELDRRSDIYSLGIILFQGMTGQLPYKSDTPMGMAVAHLTEPVPDILKVKPDLPPKFGTLITRAMAKEPDDRYQTAGDFAAELAQLAAPTLVRQGDLPDQAAVQAAAAAMPAAAPAGDRPAPAGPQSLGAPGPGAPGPSTPPPPKPAEPARSPLMWAGIAVLVLLLLGCLVLTVGGGLGAVMLSQFFDTATPTRAPTATEAPTESLFIGLTPVVVTLSSPTASATETEARTATPSPSPTDTREPTATGTATPTSTSTRPPGPSLLTVVTNVKTQMEVFGGLIDVAVQQGFIDCQAVVNQRDLVAAAPTLSVGSSLAGAYSLYRSGVDNFTADTRDMYINCQNYLANPTGGEIPFQQWGLARQGVSESVELLRQAIIAAGGTP